MKVIGHGKAWSVVMDNQQIIVDLPDLAYTVKDVMAILDAYKKAFLERLEGEKKLARKFVLGSNIEFRPKG